jgi:hypothetical protein
MTTIDRALMIQLRKEIDAALAGIATKHGLQAIRAGSSTWSTDGVSGTIKVEILSNASSGSRKMDKIEKSLDIYKHFHKDIDFDATYKLARGGNDRFTITGYNTKAREYPFILTVVGTERRYKCDAEGLKGGAYVVA